MILFPVRFTTTHFLTFGQFKRASSTFAFKSIIFPPLIPSSAVMMNSDLQSFSTISEQLTSKELVDLLNEFLSSQTEIILNNKGTLDKYEGDAILSFFGAPLFFETHAKAAIDSGVSCQNNLVKLCKIWASEGDKWPEIVHSMKMRIGVNTGEMVTGNMGSKHFMNYTY